MNKILVAGIVFFLLGICQVANAEDNSMSVTSTAFKENQMIPREFTCQGNEVNPPLTIDNIPDKTETLALINYDPDATKGIWDHWIVFNVPAPKGKVFAVGKDSILGTAGKNSWSRTAYGGPCPPSGTHRYFFKVYALDTRLNLQEGASKEEIEAAMKEHILAEAQLVGLYRKS